MSSNSKCNRCKLKEFVFDCNSCEAFPRLCRQCDTYVHSLPSKSNHIRNPLKMAELETTNSETREMDSSAIRQDTNKQANFDTEKDSYMKNDTSLQTQNSLNDQYNFQCALLPSINNQYSREYVNELKSIFEKERNSLVFKNSNLQNTLDRLKNSFSEQIAGLTSQIDESNKRHQYALRSLEENIENYYKALLIKKDEEINERDDKIRDLLESNRRISDQLNTSNIRLENSELNVKSKLNEIQNLKDSQEKRLKEVSLYYEEKLREQERVNSESFKDTLRIYEDKISLLGEEKDKSNFALQGKLKEVEIQLKELHDNFVITKEDGDRVISQLRHKNESLSYSLEFFQNKSSELESNINQVYDANEDLNSRLRDKVKEIKLLESDNARLIELCDHLKAQNKKMEKLVYGNVRQSIKNK